MIAADLIAEYLARSGVRHVFGVGGANIEDLFAAVQRRRPRIRAILAKHEHAAGCAADAYARVSGGLGVVMTTSGGGAMNLVHSLAEARAARVPLLALVGEPPSSLQGHGAFQDTSGRDGAVDAAAVFRAVSVFCRRVENPEELSRLLDAAVESALGDPPGPAVLLLAKDHQRKEIDARPHDELPAEGSHLSALRVEPDPLAIQESCGLLGARSAVIIAGPEVSRRRAHVELEQLARALGADVAVTPDARDAFDNADPRFLGVVGAMGHAQVLGQLAQAGACVLAGTRLPLLARQGVEGMLRDKVLVSLGRERPFVSAWQSRHVACDVGAGLRALSENIADKRRATAPASLTRAPLPDAERPCAEWGSRAVLRALGRAIPAGSVVLVDAGNTGATAAHDLAAPRDGAWLLAMGMAGMGYTFGAAVGAALASGQRCFVLAGDGAFYMQGLEIHTAIEHALPISYLIFDNRAHGMCLVRERLLLRDFAGYNVFGDAHLGSGLAAMFPRLWARDCRNLAEFAAALEASSSEPGPAVISVELPEVEIPPFAAFREVSGEGLCTVSRGEPHERR